MSFIIQPAAAGVGTNTAVASGTIPNGASVIMNADGTVTAVTQTSDPETIAYGAANNIPSSASSQTLSSVYDAAQNKIVILYSIIPQTYVVVGTVSGSTITFGTPVSIGLPFYADYSAGAYDPINNKSIFVANYDTGAGRVGVAFAVTVSGTTPSVGLFYTFAAGAWTPSIAYDTNAAKFLIAYNDIGGGQYGFAIVATVTGSVITFGSPVSFISSNIVGTTSTTYSSTAQKSVILFSNNSTTLCAVVATISGTTVSYGTQLTTALTSNENTSTYDVINNRIIVGYCWTGNTIVYFAVGVITGTNFALFSSTTLSSSAFHPACVYNASNGKTIVSWVSTAANSVLSKVGTSTVSTITFGSTTTVISGSSFSWTINKMIYNSGLQKIINASNGNGSGSSVQLFVGSPGAATNLTATNFFGFATNAYIGGQTASINTISSINSKQSGLTAGSGYYIQNDGTLSTTPGSPSVYAGLATGATTILIKG